MGRIPESFQLSFVCADGGAPHDFRLAVDGDDVDIPLDTTALDEWMERMRQQLDPESICHWDTMRAERDTAVRERDEAIAAFHDASRLRSEIQQCRMKAEDQRDDLRAQLDRAIEALDSPALLESMAALEHERWSGWERYREKCAAEVRRGTDPESHEARWRRQRDTPYAGLSEREKESDRVEARKSLAVVRTVLAAHDKDKSTSGDRGSAPTAQASAHETGAPLVEQSKPGAGCLSASGVSALHTCDDSKTEALGRLSSRVRPGSEAAPWVVKEILHMESERDELIAALRGVVDKLTDTRWNPSGKLAAWANTPDGRNHACVMEVLDSVRGLLAKLDKEGGK
jgi:hypothetical protein